MPWGRLPQRPWACPSAALDEAGSIHPADWHESRHDVATVLSYAGTVVDDEHPDLFESTGELEPVVPEDRAPIYDGDLFDPGWLDPAPLTADHIDADGLDPVEHPAVVPPRPNGMATRTVIIQGLLGAAVIFLVAVDPYVFTATEELIGFGLIVFGVFEVSSLARRKASTSLFIQPAVVLIGGAALIVWPAQTRVVAGLVIAGVVAVRGMLDIWAGIRRWHDLGANSWVFIRGLLSLTLAFIVFLFPAQSVLFVVVGGAVIALGRAIVAVWFMATLTDASGAVEPSDTFGIIAYWLASREMTAADAAQVEERVFLHIGPTRDRLWRFSILMGLATAIATFGIGTDSTAVVIGAMLVAPLMTPILGVAAGLINGRTRSALLSATIVLLGSVGSVALAWLLSAAIPDIQTVVQNSQVTTRTAPSLLDLAIALAAGAAGAYGVSRAESTDALPGVAVAIALVPPLAVIGVTLHAQDLGQAAGALLLFLTNLFSIVLMAGIVFVLVGYGSWGHLYHSRNRVRVAFATVAFAVLIISIPLAFTARNVIQESADLRRASAAVTEWLGDETSLRVAELTISNDVVHVQLVGPESPPSAQLLSTQASARIGRTVSTIVRWIEETEDASPVPTSIPTIP